MNSRVVLTEAFKAALCLKRGIAAMRRNEFAEAVQHFDEALAADPEDCYAHYNKATSLLSLGDYVAGFQEYEWRWKMYDWRWGLLGEDIYRVRKLPQWRGQELRGKHLLFYWEMGYGDAIQQLRYLPVLRGLGAHVTALMVPPLTRLARTFDVDVIEQIPAQAHALFDYRCSLFGVMAALAQSVEDISGQAYLPFGCGAPGGGLGLAWSGRTQTEFTLSEFLEKLTPLGWRVQSLQPGAQQTAFVQPLPPGDFLDTALLLAQMQHVVTVDTAVAHLAGAMGHRSTHVLIPYCSDWRWHNAGAWYPTLHIHRQSKPGDWEQQFVEIRAILRSTR